jgi:hypothetical protein
MPARTLRFVTLHIHVPYRVQVQSCSLSSNRMANGITKSSCPAQVLYQGEGSERPAARQPLRMDAHAPCGHLPDQLTHPQHAVALVRPQTPTLMFLPPLFLQALLQRQGTMSGQGQSGQGGFAGNGRGLSPGEASAPAGGDMRDECMCIAMCV